MPCETPPYYLISFLSGAAVAIVTTLLGHIFAARRESENRKHAAVAAKERRKVEFLGVMDGLRAEAERIVGQKYAERFPERLFEVRRESAKIESDLAADRRAIFGEKITALCRLTDSHVEEITPSGDYLGRKRVTEAIDAIVRLLR